MCIKHCFPFGVIMKKFSNAIDSSVVRGSKVAKGQAFKNVNATRCSSSVARWIPRQAFIAVDQRLISLDVYWASYFVLPPQKARKCLS